jgi:hypothetical protein
MNRLSAHPGGQGGEEHEKVKKQRCREAIGKWTGQMFHVRSGG